MYEEIREQAAAACEELVNAAGLKKGQILAVGCSSSEVGGSRIGTDSNVDIAGAVFAGIWDVLKKKEIFLAAQCCEHLNRALIVEREYADRHDLEIVNVVPQSKAGGSFATCAYSSFSDPVALEEIRADAGLDIGDTFIGMHLKRVAVPVRLNNSRIGNAHVTAARVRPKYIGGERAHYIENL